MRLVSEAISHAHVVKFVPNRFTSWEDVPLDPEGRRDAQRAGRFAAFDFTLNFVSHVH